MAPTSKTISSPKSDGHLMKEKDLGDDSEKQTGSHTNPIRKKKNLPAFEPMKLPLEIQDPAVREFVELDPESRSFEEGDELGIENGELIVGIRLYDRGSDGMPIGKDATGEEGTATHSRVRRERHHYYDVDRSKVEVGKVIRMRKANPKKIKDEKGDEVVPEAKPDFDYEDEEVDPDGDVHEPRRNRKEKYEDNRTNLERKAPGVMRTIMVRLVPHEAVMAGRWNMSKDALAKAMDQTATIFAQAVGCDVISAVVHRMREKDLHIHLQYTMIIPQLESPSALGRRRLTKWTKLAQQKTHAALAAEGRADAGPRIKGKKTLELIANGELAPKPVREIEFRKQDGKRSLGEDHILGYSLRQKLNLVRLAEDGGMPDLAVQVMKYRDKQNKFRRLAMRRDKRIEDHYMDVWLERTWRQAIKANLPEEAVKAMAAAGVEAAKDYVSYGTVMVEETHLDRKKDDLDARQVDLNAKSEAQKKEAEGLRVKIESERREVAADLALAKSSRSRAEEAAAPIVVTAKLEAAGIVKDAELRGLQLVLGRMIPGRVSKAETVEEAEKELDSGIREIRKKAEVGAWTRVLRILGKNDIPAGATPEILAQDVEKAVTGRIGEMVSRLFRIFGREVPAEARTPEEVDTALTVACEAFKTDARSNGLALAVSKIRGVEVSTITELDEAGLTAEIEAEAGKFQEGLVSQARAALVGLTHFVFGSHLGKFLIGEKNTEEKLKSVLKDEFARRGKAELTLEEAMPILAKNDRKLAEVARKIINARPQLPPKMDDPDF